MTRNVRLRAPETSPDVLERNRRAADALRQFVGKYVARKNGVVLASGESPAEVLGWLRDHDEHNATVFMAPLDPVAATSVA